MTRATSRARQSACCASPRRRRTTQPSAASDLNPIYWVRVFEEEGQTPVVVMAEHLDNPSTSVTNMAELLAAELIQKHIPRRFDFEPPAIMLEHYPTEHGPHGRVARKPTCDRLSFHSWAPRRVWLGGRERLAFGEPEWRSMPAHEVEALLGRDEMRALPPAPKQGDQPETGAPLGL